MLLVVMSVCYLEENFHFALGHMKFHVAFWEFKSLNDMSAPQAQACRHHNGEPWVYLANSAESRMFFFFDRDQWFSQGWRSLIYPGAVQGQHNIRSCIIWATCGFELMMVHRAWMVFLAAMPQIIHEWYHTPRRYRGQHFLVLYPVLSALEALRIIDT